MDSWLMLLLAAALFVGLVLFIYIARAGRRNGRFDQAYYATQWEKIEKLQNQGDVGWQLAIFEADKLLDHALKEAGYPGETMGERLKDARRVFRSNDSVWQAHKLRNRLAHEQNINLNGIVVSRALRQFRAGLKDIGAL